MRPGHNPRRAGAAALAALAALAAPIGAHASFLPPELMDKAAMYLAWLPEKIAHKRHHPQRDAIQTLCLLSLVFGGLLWPIAWLWAYTKPAGYRLAYGTEKHDDYYREMAEKAHAGELAQHEVDHLREELDAMNAKGALSAEMKALRRDLATAHAAPSASASAQAAPAGAGTSGGGS